MVAVSLKKKKKKKKKKKNIIFFFFKQKTAYEMCDSDWSSDVCSSDLAYREEVDAERANRATEKRFEQLQQSLSPEKKRDLLDRLDQDARAD